MSLTRLSLDIEHGWPVAKPDAKGPLIFYLDHSAALSSLQAKHDRAIEALQIAYDNLNGWCEAVDTVGTGWDDWDEWFKAAKYERKGKPSVLSILRAALQSSEGQALADEVTDER